MNGVDVTHLVYDEGIEYFKDRAEFPGAKTSLSEFQQAIINAGKQFGKTMENFRRSLHDWTPAMDFNLVMTPAERERRIRQERRDVFYKYRASCMHGERTFRIRWSDEALASIGGHL